MPRGFLGLSPLTVAGCGAQTETLPQNQWTEWKRRDPFAWVRDRVAYFGARLAKMRWSVRRCMLRRRAVSETLRPQSS